jgi:hypothetical protein
MELLGYLENWGPDVKWWDNNMPGNCLMGCLNAQPLIKKIAPYSSINYGFSFLTTLPDPDQDGCTNAGDPSPPAGPCDSWRGDNIYLAAASKQGSIAVGSSTNIDQVSPSIIAISEVVRMARMHPDGPKRTKIVLGGWSDFARLNTVANGEKAAELMAKFVAYTFADGVDIDMEHLTPFDKMGNEFEALHAFITKLRSELDNVAANWGQTADARRAALQKQYDALEDWQKGNMGAFYKTNIAYLQEVKANGAPKMEISWTTRFNAFLPPGGVVSREGVWNYLEPDSDIPDEVYATNYEGDNIYPQVGDLIDTVNIMAYDAATLKFNFAKIIDNFAYYGKVPLSKINMGFEPGEQAAGGVWEGKERDEQAARDIKARNVGGAMIWAINPSSEQHPQAHDLCPELAQTFNSILEPTYAWGPAPSYTKCDPSTGWGPSAFESVV